MGWYEVVGSFLRCASRRESWPMFSVVSIISEQVVVSEEDRDCAHFLGRGLTDVPTFLRMTIGCGSTIIVWVEIDEVVQIDGVLVIDWSTERM